MKAATAGAADRQLRLGRTNICKDLMDRNCRVWTTGTVSENYQLLRDKTLCPGAVTLATINS